MKTKELLCQGYIMYWCYASNIQPKEEKAEDIPIGCEFRDVFAEKLPGLLRTEKLMLRLN